MKESQNNSQLTPPQQWGIIIFRIIIGWHFLYEGIAKLMDGGWSAESYLVNARGPFSGFFHAMASNPAVLEVVNFLNVWGLILIGLGLFLGLFARVAVYGGILLLFFYYIAHPPFQVYNFGSVQEGHNLLVDKTFIELMALVILALFPSVLNLGLWSLLKRLMWRISFNSPLKIKTQTSIVEPGGSESRRDLLKHLAFLPFLGGFTWAFTNNKKLMGFDAISSSTIRLNQLSLNELEGAIPVGDLGGKMPVSRLILGGNLIQNNSHSRDLLYVNSLFKAYNTDKKVFDTLMLAEKAGINTVNINVNIGPRINLYKKLFGSKLQTMVSIVPTKEDPYGQVDQAIDLGMDYLVVQGAACDRRVHDGEIDVIVKCVDYIKKQGYPAGLGAHTIQALLACVDIGIDPDFYYKTMHHDQYWSAHPKENRYPFLWSSNKSPDHNMFHDNMWCLFPEETIDFVQKTTKPVVGFKVLAAGAIHPKDGFQWALDNGADFISVGMFDFQIVGNANEMIRCYEKASNRIRPWYG
jgi:uncharacterized membrane protein YphA (DoxX/SURF4 family)